MKTRKVTAERCEIRVVDTQRVHNVQKRLLSYQEAETVAGLFRLLGDTNRARMLYALLETGELCVCDLAATVEMPEASVSNALRLLRAAGVVSSRRAGRMVFYRLDDEHIRTLLELSRAHLRHTRKTAALEEKGT